MSPDRTTLSRTRSRLSELLDSGFMARLDALDVLSRKILRGKLQGERRSKRRGQGVEFADHRPYVVGDDLRFIDWNIYARLEQLFLKLFLEEQDLTVHVAIDVSGSIGLDKTIDIKIMLPFDIGEAKRRVNVIDEGISTIFVAFDIHKCIGYCGTSERRSKRRRYS